MRPFPLSQQEHSTAVPPPRLFANDLPRGARRALILLADPHHPAVPFDGCWRIRGRRELIPDHALAVLIGAGLAHPPRQYRTRGLAFMAATLTPAGRAMARRLTA